MIIDEFEELLLAATDQPLIMSIVLHTFISGVPFRLRQITRALEYIVGHSNDVWFTRPRDIYKAVQPHIKPKHAGALPDGMSIKPSVASGDPR
jgi:hypothetical protein